MTLFAMKMKLCFDYLMKLIVDHLGLGLISRDEDSHGRQHDTTKAEADHDNDSEMEKFPAGDQLNFQSDSDIEVVKITKAADDAGNKHSAEEVKNIEDIGTPPADDSLLLGVSKKTTKEEVRNESSSTTIKSETTLLYRKRKTKCLKINDLTVLCRGSLNCISR